MTFFGMRFNDIFKERDVFNDDLRKSAYTKNPTIRAYFDLVYVLSGRTTALGADADGLKRPFDPSDDIERLREGIRIAILVNALKANKRPEELTLDDYVTPIFYNGRAIHNQHLRQALKWGLLNYPKNLFIIRDIYPENTIGQIQSFKKDIFLNKKHKNIAVVTSGYHDARTARIIGNNSPQSKDEDGNSHPISKLKIFLYGVHKNEKRLGMLEDIKGEYDAMKRYSSGNTPSISRLPGNNVFFTDEDFYSYVSFKRAIFWSKVDKFKIDFAIAFLASRFCAPTGQNHQLDLTLVSR